MKKIINVIGISVAVVTGMVYVGLFLPWAISSASTELVAAAIFSIVLLIVGAFVCLAD